jgi:hypothetical protein
VYQIKRHFRLFLFLILYTSPLLHLLQELILSVDNSNDLLQEVMFEVPKNCRSWFSYVNIVFVYFKRQRPSCKAYGVLLT